jgi:hypothetical protein
MKTLISIIIGCILLFLAGVYADNLLLYAIAAFLGSGVSIGFVLGCEWKTPSK